MNCAEGLDHGHRRAFVLESCKHSISFGYLLIPISLARRAICASALHVLCKPVSKSVCLEGYGAIVFCPNRSHSKFVRPVCVVSAIPRALLSRSRLKLSLCGRRNVCVKKSLTDANVLEAQNDVAKEAFAAVMCKVCQCVYYVCAVCIEEREEEIRN